MVDECIYGMTTTTFSNCIQSKVDFSDFDNFDEIKKY